MSFLKKGWKVQNIQNQPNRRVLHSIDSIKYFKGIWKVRGYNSD